MNIKISSEVSALLYFLLEQPECDPSWTNIRGDCFKIFGKTSWDTAKYICEAIGGQLAMFDSWETFTLMAEMAVEVTTPG